MYSVSQTQLALFCLALLGQAAAVKLVHCCDMFQVLQPVCMNVSLYSRWMYDSVYQTCNSLRGIYCEFRLSSRLANFCLMAVSSSFCFLLSPFLSRVAPLLVGHCVRFVFMLVSLCLRSCLPSCGSLCPPCLPSVSFCLPSCPPSCWSLCPPCFPSVSFCLPSCPPSCWSLCPPCFPSAFLWRSCLPSCFPLSRVLSPFLLVIVSVLSPFCFLFSPFLFPFLLVIVSVLSPFFPFVCLLVSLHCVRLVSLLASLCVQSCLTSCWSLCPSCLASVPFLSSLLSPFLLVIVSALSSFLSPFVSLLVGHCVRLVSLLFPFVSLLVGHCVRLVPLSVSFCLLLLMYQKVDLGMLRCCLTCLGSTVVYFSIFWQGVTLVVIYSKTWFSFGISKSI